MHDINHYLRSDHLQQLRSILDDPEASDNDRFVATELLQNANIAAGGILPMCQDTGTAVIMGRKGEQVLTFADDAEAISQRRPRHVSRTSNLRYSQLAPLDMFTEVNTGNNLPAQIEIHSKPGDVLRAVLHGQGRRLGQQVVPVPEDQGAAQRARRCSTSATRPSDRSAPRRARPTISPSWSGAPPPSTT